MVALLIGMGAWFAFDGWHGYPKENALVDQLDGELDVLQKQLIAAKQAADLKATDQLQADYDKLNLERSAHKKHQSLDIRFQKILAVGLPILGAISLVWALYNSRGAYRLAGQILSVPGHPPVRLSQIIMVDKIAWDRKGIAYIEYRLDQKRGRLKLDDYVYDRDSTDEIFKKIEETLAPPVLPA